MKTFWQHTNGLIYVIESDSFGHITGGTGPIEPVGVRDPSEYKCGPGIVAWAKQSIVERKLWRVNLAIDRDSAPAKKGSEPGALRPRAPRPDQISPQAVVPAPSRPPETPSDTKRREMVTRRKFPWSSAFRL